jgi:hypothetical protein
MQIAGKKSEEAARKKNGAELKLAKNATVHNWLIKRGKHVKKLVDAKTRRDMKEVRAH